MSTFSDLSYILSEIHNVVLEVPCQNRRICSATQLCNLSVYFTNNLLAKSERNDAKGSFLNHETHTETKV